MVRTVVAGEAVVGLLAHSTVLAPCCGAEWEGKSHGGEEEEEEDEEGDGEEREEERDEGGRHPLEDLGGR